MEGTARTVFRGSQPEDFPIRILGILRQNGPEQNLILARLLTPRLEQTGVMQGMSGSPVYIDGRLLGAIAFSFPFAKEPIAGIRPIEEMLAASAQPSRLLAGLHLGSTELVPTAPQQTAGPNTPQRVIALQFSGLSEHCLSTFRPQWSSLGFAVAQQGTGGSRPNAPGSSVAAGDMISVQLMRGDMVAGADGTVTRVSGNQLHAFGHRFLSGGAVEFPFAKAEVITPLANWNTPFKISQSLAEAGTITLDADAGVSGVIGQRAKLAPVTIRYREGATQKIYRLEVVRHSVLSPLLLQMAIFSAMDHHFRSAGNGTVKIQGKVTFSGLPALQIDSVYAGDANLPIAVSLGAAIPLAFLQQQLGGNQLPESMEFDLESSPKRSSWAIDRIQALKRQAKPGETLPIRAILSNSEGQEKSFSIDLPVPAWIPPGETLTITVGDAFSTNLLDFRNFYQPGGPVVGSASELVQAVNRLHPANAFYVRAFRSSAAYTSQGLELANLPGSVAASLQRNAGVYQALGQSRWFDKEFRIVDGPINGNRTITIEVEK